MTPEDFVTVLNDLAPGIGKIESIGFSSEEAEDFIKTYKCIDRDEIESLTLTDEALSALFSKWDLSQITIGMVELLDLPQEYGSHIQIGLVETDPRLVPLTEGMSMSVMTRSYSSVSTSRSPAIPSVALMTW